MAGEPTGGQRKPSDFPAAFAIGIVVVLILLGALLLVTRVTQSHGPAPIGKLPFGPDEQTYAQRVHFQPGQMSQSSNLLNQEFTYVGGTVSNDGTRSLKSLDVVLEFRDPFNQVVLRDPQRVIGPESQPLNAGKSRDFQLTLGAHLPVEWNRQYPVIRITGLVVE